MSMKLRETTSDVPSAFLSLNLINALTSVSPAICAVEAVLSHRGVPLLDCCTHRMWGNLRITLKHPPPGAR